MKYIEVDKLRAEIERLKAENESIKCASNSAYCTGYDDAFYDLLPFLDTLQEQEVKEQKAQDTVGRVSVEIRSNLQTDEVVRKTLIMLVNDGRISVTGAITSSDILNWLEGQQEPEVDLATKEATVPYIRKDALLEWLEGKMTQESATEGFVGGYNFALKDVINKLNSM